MNSRKPIQTVKCSKNATNKTHCTLLTQLTAIFLQLIHQTKNTNCFFPSTLIQLHFVTMEIIKWNSLANLYIDVQIKNDDSILIGFFCLSFSFETEKIHSFTNLHYNDTSFLSKWTFGRILSEKFSLKLTLIFWNHFFPLDYKLKKFILIKKSFNWTNLFELFFFFIRRIVVVPQFVLSNRI